MIPEKRNCLMQKANDNEQKHDYANWKDVIHNKQKVVLAQRKKMSPGKQKIFYAEG